MAGSEEPSATGGAARTPRSAAPPPRLGRPPVPPPGPTDAVRTRTVTGTVREVAGRLVLERDGVRWALRGPVGGLAPGITATVTGRPTGEVDDACGDAVLRVTSIGG